MQELPMQTIQEYMRLVSKDFDDGGYPLETFYKALTRYRHGLTSRGKGIGVFLLKEEHGGPEEGFDYTIIFAHSPEIFDFTNIRYFRIDANYDEDDGVQFDEAVVYPVREVEVTTTTWVRDDTYPQH